MRGFLIVLLFLFAAAGVQGASVNACLVSNGNCSLTAGSVSICTPTGNSTRNCTACAAGFGSAPALSGYGNCTLCSPGTASTGPSNCQPCRPGTFANTTGLSTCSACANGTIAANFNTQVCSPCGPDQTSNATHTGCVRVSCAPGYQRLTPMANCTLIPCNKTASCAVNNGGCFPIGQCTDTACNVTCECPDHFEGNGYQCVDINECLGNPCPNSTTCFNSMGTYECIGCPAGLTFTPGGRAVVPLVNLTAANTFGALANTSILASNLLVVYSGNVGVFPGTLTSGVVAVAGTVSAGTPTAQQAITAAATALATLNALPCTQTLSSAILAAGTTLTPNVYCFSGPPAVVTIQGTLTLDGLQQTDPAIVIRIPLALNISASAQIVATNGSRPCDVFWTVGTSARFMPSATEAPLFTGVLIAQQNITMVTGAFIRHVGAAFSLRQGIVATSALIDSSWACATTNCTYIDACAVNNGNCGNQICVATNSNNRTCVPCAFGSVYDPVNRWCNPCIGLCGANRNCTFNGTTATCGACRIGFASLGAGNCTALDDCPTLSPLLLAFDLSSPTTIDSGTSQSSLFGNVSVGSSPAFTDPGLVTLSSGGTVQTQNAATTSVQAAVNNLYLSLVNLPCTTPLSVTELTGLTLYGGNVYCFPSDPAEVTVSYANFTALSLLYLSADPDQRIVIQVPHSLRVGPAAAVTLVGNTSQCNVFWVASNFTFIGAEEGVFRGVVTVLGSTDMRFESVLFGQLYSVNGPVSINGTVIQSPQCGVLNDTCAAWQMSSSSSSSSSTGSGDPCEPNPCLHDGRCRVNRRGRAECRCQPGWEGRYCQTRQSVSVFDFGPSSAPPPAFPAPIPYPPPPPPLPPTPVEITGVCSRNPCQNGAECIEVRAGQSFRCACLEGFTGSLCEQSVSVCGECLHGGACNEARRACVSCDAPWTGTHCQEKDQAVVCGVFGHCRQGKCQPVADRWFDDNDSLPPPSGFAAQCN